MHFIIGLFIIIISYLLGSIPFGLVVTKWAGLGDIRKIGSGNIGATNVMRTGNKYLAAATFALDAAKGALAVILATLTGSHLVIALSAIAVVSGHVFPVWLDFKGGKGVATTIAVFMVIYFKLALIICALWILIFQFSRMSSVSSILSIIFSVAFAFALAPFYIFFVSLVLAGIIIYRHQENIRRIMSGEELAFKKKD